MQFLVIFRVEPSLHDPAQVEGARAQGFPFFSTIESDPRVAASGHFADGRAGFLLIEVDSAEEMFKLTGQFLDFVHFETHPVLPFGRMLKVFEELAGQG